MLVIVANHNIVAFVPLLLQLGAAPGSRGLAKRTVLDKIELDECRSGTGISSCTGILVGIRFRVPQPAR